MHERLIPAVRVLSGSLLAEATQAALALDRSYRAWARDSGSANLLFGRELRLVLRHRPEAVIGVQAKEKLEFLRRSRRQRDWRRAAFAVGWSMLVVVCVGVLRYQSRQELAVRLASWGLPADLGQYLEQLEVLRLSGRVSSIEWLEKAANLRSLDLSGTQIEAGHLPENLQSLRLGAVSGRFLSLPEGIQSLDLTENSIIFSFREFSSRLRSIKMRGFFDPQHRLPRLPDSLRTLEVGGMQGSSLKRLPGLRSLVLSETLIATRFGDFFYRGEGPLDWPSGLESLDLRGGF